MKATQIKYFSDFNGETHELAWTESIKNDEFGKLFPGVRGLRYDSFSKRVGRVGLTIVPLTRVIEYKKEPSLHVCNARCLGGKRNGTCECQCGGKNHGRGGEMNAECADAYERKDDEGLSADRIHEIETAHWEGGWQ